MNSSMLTVSMRAESLLARLTGAGDRMHDGLHRVIQRLAIKAQGKVKGDKLSGQVLHVRTGTLRRSINQKIEETAGSIYAKVGTNVRYARIHEFGFQGVENVRAHVRHLKSGKDQNVRAHTRNVNVPPRSFLRSTLADMTPEIQTDIRTAMLQALKP